RAVRLALLAQAGEMGYPSALSAPTWGFCDASFGGQPLRLARPYGSYVMENVLFKISFPAEFHAQSAVEAAIDLHRQLARAGRSADEIGRVAIRTHQACLRIIDKPGPLRNPADRDHCIQYMVAVALLFGRLEAGDYEDAVALDPRIDALRAKMACMEEPAFSADYLNPDKRSIANGVTLQLQDGSQLGEVLVEYPIGHARRRGEAIPLLIDKFKANLARSFSPTRQEQILTVSLDKNRLEAMPVYQYSDMYAITYVI
ncbi:MAG: MmgE/PrpD family protein, partial [Burkholderiaceae bacterium]|nr:MmgE/PrpD family protein [Burkholderiaceae bacterium]